jgi:parallel beta-helix repeat protein
MYNKIEKSLSPYDDCAGLYVDGGKNIYLGENIISESQYGIEIGNEKKNLLLRILLLKIIKLLII